MHCIVLQSAGAEQENALRVDCQRAPNSNVRTAHVDSLDSDKKGRAYRMHAAL